MKIVVLYPNSPFAGWSAAKGIGPTLVKMGHEVLDIPVNPDPRATPMQVEETRRGMPPAEILKQYDLILSAGTEHIGPWIDAVYGIYDWKHLGVPKAAWFHESFNRDDYNLDFGTLCHFADEFFFPAIQDAEFHDQESFAPGRAHWLPFGVDTSIFKPLKEVDGYKIEKHFGVAFMGLFYGKRKGFMDVLRRHAIPTIKLGNVQIADLHGYQHEESTRRYAANLREITVFLNLPAMSRLLVNKVYEVLACGTFLLTPFLPTEQGVAANMQHFKDKEHLRYYKPTNLPYLAQIMNEYLTEDFAAERERIAAAGCKEVHEKHSLKMRLEEILAKTMKEKAAVA